MVFLKACHVRTQTAICNELEVQELQVHMRLNFRCTSQFCLGPNDVHRWATHDHEGVKFSLDFAVRPQLILLYNLIIYSVKHSIFTTLLAKFSPFVSVL